MPLASLYIYIMTLAIKLYIYIYIYIYNDLGVVRHLDVLGEGVGPLGDAVVDVLPLEWRLPFKILYIT